MFGIIAILITHSKVTQSFITTRYSNPSQLGKALLQAERSLDFDERSSFDADRRSIASAKFPYGECSFRTIKSEGSFLIDKTAFIRTLETSGKFNKIWRPRRFGKTLICDMLTEYYDAANSKEQLDALFGDTYIMREKLNTEEMGRYLILNLSFSGLSIDGDFRENFRKYMNAAIKDFSLKYHDEAGFLKRPVEIDPEDSLYSLNRLFSEVKLSGHQIYLIVDECDSFVNKMLLCIDSSKPDSGLKEYETTVSGKESMLRTWGDVVKIGTRGPIARMFFTGVTPQAFSDGLSGLNMVKDLTFAPKLEGLFGLTKADLSHGLQMIDRITDAQRVEYLELMRVQYDGYRFVRTQKEALFNPQYVLYFLNHLEEYGAPPESLVDPVVSGPTDNVAEYLIANYKAGAPYSLPNRILGYLRPNEMGTFDSEVVPSFRSTALFRVNTVSEVLISLAFFHGFLTFKPDKDQRVVLTSTNIVMQTVYVRALFAGLPEQWTNQMAAIICTAQPDWNEIKRIAQLGIEETTKEFGKTVGKELARNFALVFGNDKNSA